ncbi:MAG: DegT/DnrJ/EryC1/StrS family aminotransferase [Anaerolineales bacterium]|nr:DegT/DnrJ/EryC1/StrS family aminotransferase [Anaerolineales bacterium]
MTKLSLTDLAIFGGSPAFDETLHIGRPNIGNRERLLARINDMLDRRWLTNRGPYVIEFEQMLAEFLNVKHCICVCNATIGLEIAIRALGLTGEVIVPSFTFIATAHALQWQEITPVFCDIDPKTHNINPARIESLITPRTTGIVGVHIWGRPCDITAMEEISQRRGIRLLFDAAHALGCTYQGKMIGNFGQVEVFSFHATKFFNSFEGGAITTNDDQLAEKIRLMQNFGFAGMDNVIYIGTNGKMTEVSAAMGLTSLESIAEFTEINRQNYHFYHRELNGVPGLKMIRYNEAEKNNFQYVIVEVDAAQAGIHRDTLIKVLHAENARVRRYFYPACHNMEPYRSYFPHAGLLLPETERLAQRCISLPTGTAMDEERIVRLAQLIRYAISNGPEITVKIIGSQPGKPA